jgi:UDP-N-acetylmuramoyl-L-alanyl-D-glutamate--2,6-diaminopimelate ligase
MKLVQLFSLYHDFKMGDDPMTEVKNITIDSRHATDGDVFIAIKGSQKDSHDYLIDVCHRGVVGVVIEDPTRLPPDYRGAVLVVPRAREAAMKLAGRFYGDPSQKLHCVGVTGTNGKTSTTYMIEAVLNHFGMKTGVLGTINHHCGDKRWESSLTTPDPITLQKRMRDFVALDAKAVAFEVSSHALDQDRVTGVPFGCAVFTNLTRDHLDYHKTFENYFRAKEKLFTNLSPQKNGEPAFAIINQNDEWGRQIRIHPQAYRWTYGEVQSDFQFQILESLYSGSRVHLNTPRGEIEFRVPLPGRHNVYNAVAAIAVGLSAGASLQRAVEGIESFLGVPGRLERVHSAKSDLNVFVDYAHTDDALRSVLSNLSLIRQQSKSGGAIITVFGCGGDRDRGKRPLMAQAAIEHSDCFFITSDNPRTEDPLAIIQDILTGVPKALLNSKVFVEVERSEAIRKAIAQATPKDVVVIAGKGHETYQIVGETKHEFDDVKVAQGFMSV